MLSLTAIGSCRVTNPARKASTRHDITLNNGRIYGYVHSSAEIVQQVEFFRARKTIPQNLWPLIAPHTQQETFVSSPVRNSDCYLVEISSAKNVKVGPVSVQWNHVCRHFEAFLSDASRARTFWTLSNPATSQEKQSFLDSEATFKCLSPADKALLMQMTVEPATLNSLISDIRKIVAALGNVLFVTHCNALLPDEKPIPSRHKFINLLKSALTYCNADFDDPTILMNEFGQAKALLAEGDSYTHYSLAFEKVLFDHWYEQHLKFAARPAARTIVAG